MPKGSSRSRGPTGIRAWRRSTSIAKRTTCRTWRGFSSSSIMKCHIRPRHRGEKSTGTCAHPISARAWSVRQCRRLHDRPFQRSRPDDGLLTLLVGKRVPKKEGDEEPIVERTQLSARLTDAERRLPNDPPHAVLLHRANDFPRGVRQQ